MAISIQSVGICYVANVSVNLFPLRVGKVARAISQTYQLADHHPKPKDNQILKQCGNQTHLRYYCI